MLEEGREPPAELVALCKAGRSGSDETMLHWYAIEGEPRVVGRLIELGYDVDVRDRFGTSAIHSAAILGRWDVVRLLRRAGARRSGVDGAGRSYRSRLSEVGTGVPADLRADAYQPADLLLPGGPEHEPICSISLTRAGLPDDAPGTPLSLETWQDFAERDPGLDLDRADGECSFLVADRLHGGVVMLEDSAPALGAPQIYVLPEGDATLRITARIAQHFGARVLLVFVAPDLGRAPGAEPRGSGLTAPAPTTPNDSPGAAPTANGVPAGARGWAGR